MLQTPIKPYGASATAAPSTSTTAEGNPKKLGGVATKPDAAGSGDEEEEEGSPNSSPQQHSSSDNGSDLEDLLTKDFPQDDLPSLITRAMGKGREGREGGREERERRKANWGRGVEKWGGFGCD